MNESKSPRGPADGTVRINRRIAQSGLCSRRQADAWIADGRVTLNGQPATPGDRAGDADDVRVDGNPLPGKPAAVVLALNKPEGITCTTDRRVRDNVIDFIDYPDRIFPVGRLDRESHGLLLLTNDGDLANGILHASNNRDKEYHVRVDRSFPDEFLNRLASGVPILGRTTRPCRTTRLGPDRFRIVLRQGLNRQIRRMCEALGYAVTDLERTRIMNITLGSLKTGHWRELTPKETRDLNDLLTRPTRKARTR